MPYDYEVLKNHIATVHPELLDAFVEGWNCLGSESQAYWHQQGLVAPKEKVKSKRWVSWTAVKMMQSFTSKSDDVSLKMQSQDFENRLIVLFHNSIQNSGQFFGLPIMPPVGKKVFKCPAGCHKYSSERHLVAKDVARVIIQSDLRKLLVKWKKDLGEMGVDALRKAYSDAVQMKDDAGGKFDIGDFPPDVDCHSDSDLDNGH